MKLVVVEKLNPINRQRLFGYFAAPRYSVPGLRMTPP